MIRAAEGMKEFVTDAIRYWEPRRIIYNAVLAAIVLGYAVVYRARLAANLSLDGVLVVFLLAVVANILYCAAYAVDVVCQMSAFREQWRRNRWILLTIGVLVAAVLTRFWSIAMFKDCCG